MAENETRPSAASASPAASARRAKGNARKEARTPRTGMLVGGLALIFASIALTTSGYLGYLLFYERPGLLTADLVGAVGRLEREHDALKESLQGLEPQIQTLQETQDTIKAALERITSDLARRRTEWTLAEAEQLLVIANNRLQLARDVRSALVALRGADALLHQLADPNLLPVRRLLAREINALSALEKADVPGISLRLGVLAEGVDRLPLALAVRLRETTGGGSPAAAPAEAASAAAAAAAAEEAGWRAAARSLWSDLRALVRIRTDVEVQRPLLPPEQQYFARENLRLMLYGAQLALLQGNTAIYRQNLEAADRLLKQFFDLDTQAVAAMQSELDKLKSERIIAELPDISASLESLRRVLAGRQGA